MLELRDLTKIYNAGTVTEMTLFDHFNLTVDDGQFVSIVGSNGSGKTSLLNILCGSIPLDGGDVLVGGKSIRKQKDFQRYATIGRVYQNRKRIDFYRAELASLGLGLEDKLDVKMGALSGGQRQAVALLMATMTPLNFLILDEHTAALDPKTAETIMVLTGKVVKEKKLTALMVTHNLRYAVEYGDRLLMLHHGQIVLDKAGEEKAKVTTEGLLEVFNRYSIL